VRRRARPPQHRLARLALPRAGAAREAALVAVPGRDERGGDRRHPGRNPRGLDRAGRLRSGLRGGGLCERDHHLALHRRAGHVAARRAPRPEARPWRRRRRSRRSDAGDIDVRGLGTAGGVASGAPARAASTLVRRRRRTARATRPSTISSAHRRHRGRSHAKEFVPRCRRRRRIRRRRCTVMRASSTFGVDDTRLRVAAGAAARRSGGARQQGRASA